MKKTKEDALEEFLENEKAEKTSKKDDDAKKVVMRQREGLIERVENDRILVTKDGKQLLREQY